MFSLSPIDMQYDHDKDDNGDLHSGGERKPKNKIITSEIKTKFVRYEKKCGKFCVNYIMYG